MDKKIIHTIFYNSPVGWLQLEANEEAITLVKFADSDGQPVNYTAEESGGHPVLREAIRQLDAYFSGDRKRFDLPLAPAGTAFQQSVWRELQQIPYGQTLSYSDIARQLGDRNKVRAVGTANGRNPICILIPCHRVIGANKKLVGYSGGINRKKKLLQIEGVVLL